MDEEHLTDDWLEGLSNYLDTDPFTRCDLCHEAVQSDGNLTMCMDCGCDYCSNCGTPNLHQDAMGTCMDCGRSKVGIV